MLLRAFAGASAKGFMFLGHEPADEELWKVYCPQGIQRISVENIEC
jgi:hypothetical protein